MNERKQNDDYLRIISVCYYVLGALTMLLSLLPLFHVFLGIMILSGEMNGKQPPPAFIGVLFVLIGALVICIIAAFGGCLLYTGKCFRERRHYIFCMVMSGLSCSSFPLGTVLGVFSIILLSKPEVRAEFETTVIEQASAAVN